MSKKTARDEGKIYCFCKLKHYVILSVIVLCVVSCDQLFPPTKTAPPKDQTISTSTTRLYVNKLYVSLLGKSPKEEVLIEAINLLKSCKLSMQCRRDFIQSIINQPAYNDYLYIDNYSYLLNFIFTPENIPETIDIWLQYPGTLENIAEIKRLILMDCIPDHLADGSLSTRGLQRRLSFNSFYDFANMGTENFVVSMFQNFLLRYPTKYELEEGSKMVDGQSAVLFAKVGCSKKEFVDIFFDTFDYYEGQVRILFIKFLHREPNSKEMVQFTKQYLQSDNFQELQKSILSTDEFVGV